MARFPWRLLTVDIDGTLTTEHGWRPIAVARGRLREYEASRRALMAGKEDEDTHLTRLLENASGLRLPELAEMLEHTHRVQGIAETVEALHARGARVALLTHNPALIIRWYSRRFGFDGGSGGWGLTERHGRVQPPRGVRADKVRGLREIRRRFPVPPGSICHIGDAWPDARLAPLLGGFIAFNPKRAVVARVADATVRGRDLRAILPTLEHLRPRRPLNDAVPLDEGSNSPWARTAGQHHEYVVLEAQHPKWLNLHLPNEVAELLQFRPAEVKDLRTPARGISFLSRGPGTVRAVASLAAAELIPLETLRNRFIAPAAVTERGIFNLPGAVARHLGVQVAPRAGSEVRGTDDQLIWFLPAPEDDQDRAVQQLGRPWTGPSTGGFAHLYLTKSLLPMDPELAVLEGAIEAEEWRPRLEALSRAQRPRRTPR